MGSDEVVEMCQKIYARHREALDLIFEHRPDLQNDIAEIVKNLISEFSNLVAEPSNKTSVRFSTDAFNQMQDQLSGDGSWTGMTKVLLFEVENKNNGVFIKLLIGPSTKPEFRKQLFEAARSNKNLSARKNLSDKWSQIYRKELLSESDLLNLSEEEIEVNLREKWERWIMGDLPAIEKAFEKLTTG